MQSLVYTNAACSVLTQRGRCAHSPRTMQTPHTPLKLLIRQHVGDALRAGNWNVSQAARDLDVDRRTLYRWLERWGIDPDRERRKAERQAKGAAHG